MAAIEAEQRKLASRIAKQLASLTKGATFGKLPMASDTTLSSLLSRAAMALVEEAFAGFAPDAEIVDYHTHIIGKGRCCDTGCFCPDAQNVLKAAFMRVLEADSGVHDPTTADADYVDQLLRLRYRQKHVVLAFDAHYREDGTVDLSKTGMMTPNEYVWRLCKEHPEAFIPSCSVHPYRKDALQELAKAHANGARLIKWLPNSMGIDPSSPLCDAYYQCCAELGMVILSHCGEEKAVTSDPKFQLMGNPLLFRRALSFGCKVIIAHCASLGMLPDLDVGEPRPLVSCFELFLRMMRDARYTALLFGDISALTLVNRFHKLAPVLQATEIHGRLVNGTDYPLVAVSILNRTRPFHRRVKLITKTQRKLLQEIYKVHFKCACHRGVMGLQWLTSACR